MSSVTKVVSSIVKRMKEIDATVLIVMVTVVFDKLRHGLFHFSYSHCEVQLL